MKKILYVYRTARKSNLQKVIKKLEPDHILYGLNHLQKLGYQVNFSDIAYNKFNILFWFFLPLQIIIIKLTNIGFKIDQAILLLPKILDNDIIITTVDSAGLPVLLLKMLGVINKKVVYISIGLVNEINNKNNIIVNLYKKLFNLADFIIVHSKEEKILYQKINSHFANKVLFTPFCIDTNFFTNNVKSNEGFILSVGRDKSRDYSLLSEVAKQMKDQKFVLVTSKENIEGISFPDNVQIKFDLNYQEIKKFYIKANLVFLPMKEINRASGQINFLESLASKNIVVVAKVKAIFNVYADLKNSPNVYFYQSENLSDAITKIQKALKNKFKKINLKKYSSKHQANILKNIIENLS